MNAIQDLGFALRSLRAHPGTALFAIATLALGLGAAFAIHAVVSTLLLRDLSYPDPDRIVQLRERAADGTLMDLAWLNYSDLAANGSFAASAYTTSLESPTVSGSRVRRTSITWTGGEFFRVMATRPELGRTYAADEHQPVAVISHAYWHSMFDGRADVLGQAVEVEGTSAMIIGVMPAAFEYPASTSVWLPFTDAPGESRSAHNWTGIARLASDQSLNSARLAATTLATRLRHDYGDAVNLIDFDMTPLARALAAPVHDALLLLAAGTAFLLMIAMTNTTNLLLAFNAARSRELAVRAALGANVRRLAGQLFAEGCVLASAACVLGLALAWVAIRFLVHNGSTILPRASEIGIDARTVAFAIAGALVIALLTTLTVLADQRHRATTELLREGGHGQSAGRRHLRLRAALLVGQTALTTVLLIGAGLLTRSFLSLLSVDPGFDAAQAMTVQLSRPYSRDPAVTAQTAQRYAALLDAIRALPGVEAAGGINALPLEAGSNGAFWDGSVTSLVKAPKPIGYAEYRVATDGYLQAAGIGLLAGRAFDARDRDESLPVALISRAAARATWGDADPLGKRIQYGNMDGDLRVLTIVGVVGDVSENRLDRAPSGTVYVNLAQRPRAAANFNLVVRSNLPLQTLAENLRQLLDRDAQDIPHAITSLADTRNAALANRSFSLLLLGAFAVVAFVLAVGGLYGLMAFSVGQRRHELAVRQALGAKPARIAGAMIATGLRIGMLGIALGLIAALHGLRTMGHLLYGVTSSDPLTFAVVALVLLATLFIACAVPARSAAKTDPAMALRSD